MSETHGKSLYFMWDSVDYSAYVMEVTGLPGDVEQADVSTAGSTGHRWCRGLHRAAFSVKFVCDGSATFEAFEAPFATTVDTFIYGPYGSTGGYKKFTGSAWIKKAPVPEKVTDAVTFTVEFLLDGALTETTF